MLKLKEGLLAKIALYGRGLNADFKVVISARRISLELSAWSIY